MKLYAKIICLMVLVILPAAPAARAGIAFDAATRTIHAVGYPDWFPCTPALLLAADRRMGWDLVEYEPTADVYTVAANLAIGDNARTLTYFQLGAPNHPGETLAVSGNVTVAQGEIPEPYYRASQYTTRLQIGFPDQPDIQPALKLFSSKSAPHAIKVRGQLHVWHGAITAAMPDRDHMIGNPHLDLNADSLILHKATVSWVRGIMTFYARKTVYKEYRLEQTVFEHGGTAVMDAGRMAEARGCVFRDLDAAVLDWGSLDTVLRDCRFEGNRRNWHLRFTAQGVVCIDCELTPPLSGNIIIGAVDKKTGAARRPRAIIRRHIRVAALDRNSRPLSKVRVEVINEQHDRQAVDNGVAATGEDGHTPGAGQAGAILLTERLLRAGDAGEPEEQKFTYTIRAAAEDGRAAVRQNFAPTASWEVVTLIVEKE